MIVAFPHATPAVKTRPVQPATCPLCGGLFRARGCTLGRCEATPAPDSPEAGRIAANRAILVGDLVEVTFGLRAYDVAIAAARARGTPCATYIEERFPLAMRRRILLGYVEGPAHG